MPVPIALYYFLRVASSCAPLVIIAEKLPLHLSEAVRQIPKRALSLLRLYGRPSPKGQFAATRRAAWERGNSDMSIAASCAVPAAGDRCPLGSRPIDGLTAEVDSVVFSPTEDTLRSSSEFSQWDKSSTHNAWAVGGSRHANTALFFIEVGGNNRFSCRRHLPNLFTIALRQSARVIDRKCKLGREQRGIERGSAHHQPPECLYARNSATGAGIGKTERENSSRM